MDGLGYNLFVHKPVSPNSVEIIMAANLARFPAGSRKGKWALRLGDAPSLSPSEDVRNELTIQRPGQE